MLHKCKCYNVYNKNYCSSVVTLPFITYNPIQCCIHGKILQSVSTTVIFNNTNQVHLRNDNFRCFLISEWMWPARTISAATIWPCTPLCLSFWYSSQPCLSTWRAPKNIGLTGLKKTCWSLPKLLNSITGKEFPIYSLS